MAAFGQLMQRLNAMHGTFTLKQQNVLDLEPVASGHKTALEQTQQQLSDLERIAGEQLAALVQTKRQVEEAKGELDVCEKEAKGLMQSYATGTASTVTNDTREQLGPSVGSTVVPVKLHALDIQHNEYIASLERAKRDACNEHTTAVPQSNIIVQPKVRVRSLPVIHERFSTVVRINGTWTEISCPYCGVNASVHSKAFFKGVDRLGQHIAQLHHLREELSHMRGETEDYCNKRAVSSRDVASMLRGRDPEDTKIPMVFFATLQAHAHLPKNPLLGTLDGLAADKNSLCAATHSANKRRASQFEMNLAGGEVRASPPGTHDDKRRRQTYGGPGTIDLCDDNE